ncbi:uncharacterized protein C8orf34 homolog isoform X2 [Ptychodera flava]|uniref:uncharacterized protein C8orf34 homolog isoform X2 n=1 Tax=Ptychodera flava TaxID=63121 RepID=UPI00396A8593
MATQHRVQAYLEKHQIGALFEDLMARLIQNTPEEPIPYLIKVLQRKDDKTKRPYQENPLATRSRPPSGSSKKSGSVTRSYEDLPRSKTSSDVLRRSTGGAAQWAATDPMGVSKGDRGYDKPWATNMKRSKPSTQTSTSSHSKFPMDDSENARPAGRRTKKPEWDHHTKMTTQNFDEMFEATKRSGASKSGWGSQEQDEDLLYTSSGYRGVQRQPVRAEEDALAGELVLPKYRPKQEDEGYSTSSSVASRHEKPDKKAKSHKKELEKYIKSRQKQQTQILAGDDDDDADDEAIDLLENLDDLRSEGVTKVKSSGNKVSKSFHHGKSEPQVRVSICARCAKIMGGRPSERAPSEYGPAGGYGELPDYDELASDYTGAGHFAPVVDDDEFESVSQVHSPRRPVWHDDTDTSTIDPREGAHMYHARRSTTPRKGRPMYGRDIKDSGYLPEDSDDTMNGNRPIGPSSEVLESTGHGWTPRTYRSDTEVGAQDISKKILVEESGSEL